MLFSGLRLVMIPLRTYKSKVIQPLHQQMTFTKAKQLETKPKPYYDEQINYIKSSIENEFSDWISLKQNVLSKQGNINQKNIDAIVLKNMMNMKKFDAALSFAEHLKTTNEELSIGAVNGLLALYGKLGMKGNLSKDQKQCVLDMHIQLYKKYKVLDFSTSEKLVIALCVIDEWEKALKVLADIHLSTTPSHFAYSTVIATLFRLNKRKKAFELIEESLSHKRALQESAFDAWMNYILRKYKDKTVILKHLDEICVHLAKHCAVVDVNTAVRLKDIYSSLEWNAQFTRIRKNDGLCTCCKETLDRLELSDEEFTSLQKVIKDKLIVGSDLFLKTSPDELKKFSDFIDKSGPYDVVLDALNISYAVGNGFSFDRLSLLEDVVDYFVKRQKKILVLGRRHMLRWSRNRMDSIRSKASTFFTEDLSQDDPYFITAAILSGPHTDIVSKDLLRGHKFLIKEENLRNYFKRWQWQHQWMVFMSANKGVIIQSPLRFTPSAQKKNKGWHLPYEREVTTTPTHINDGIPDLSSWLCLRPKV